MGINNLNKKLMGINDLNKKLINLYLREINYCNKTINKGPH